MFRSDLAFEKKVIAFFPQAQFRQDVNSSYSGIAINKKIKLEKNEEKKRPPSGLL